MSKHWIQYQGFSFRSVYLIKINVLVQIEGTTSRSTSCWGQTLSPLPLALPGVVGGKPAGFLPALRSQFHPAATILIQTSLALPGTKQHPDWFPWFHCAFPATLCSTEEPSMRSGPLLAHQHQTVLFGGIPCGIHCTRRPWLPFLQLFPPYTLFCLFTGFSAKPFSASGPLHLSFPLCGTLILQIFRWLGLFITKLTYQLLIQAVLI